jgi:hypothetical protein
MRLCWRAREQHVNNTPKTYQLKTPIEKINLSDTLTLIETEQREKEAAK